MSQGSANYLKSSNYFSYLLHEQHTRMIKGNAMRRTIVVDLSNKCDAWLLFATQMWCLAFVCDKQAVAYFGSIAFTLMTDGILILHATFLLLPFRNRSWLSYNTYSIKTHTNCNYSISIINSITVFSLYSFTCNTRRKNCATLTAHSSLQ